MGGAADCVIGNQQNYRPNDGNEQAVKVQSGHARTSKRGENPTSRNRANDAQNDIQEDALTRFIYDLACDKSSYQS